MFGILGYPHAGNIPMLGISNFTRNMIDGSSFANVLNMIVWTLMAISRKAAHIKLVQFRDRIDAAVLGQYEGVYFDSSGVAKGDQ